MKIFFTVILSFLFMGVLHAQETISAPITLAIVGTTNYSDVNIIIRNLKRSPHIRSLANSFSSRAMLKFSGYYDGEKDLIIEEISGLAQDRFSIELPKQKKDQNTLEITLRKITQ